MSKPQRFIRLNPAIRTLIGVCAFGVVTSGLGKYVLDTACIQAKEDRLISHILSASHSIQIYLSDSDGVFPPVQSQASFQKVMAPYWGSEITSDPEPFVKPDKGVDTRFNTNLSNVKVDVIPNPEKVVDLWTPYSAGPDSPPVKYLFGLAAGRGNDVKPSDWPPYQATLNQAFPGVSDDFYPPDFGAP